MQRWSLIFVFLALFAALPSKAAEGDPTGASEEAKELGLSLEVRVPNRGASRYTLWYDRKLSGSFGLYATAEKESYGWKQFHLGPTWKPVPWLQLGVGVGRESQRGEFSSATRRAFFFEANPEDVSISGYFENGASARWHNLTATYSFTKRFGAGLMKETGFGFGPRAEWKFENGISVWSAVLRGRFEDPEDGVRKGRSTSMLGIEISF